MGRTVLDFRQRLLERAVALRGQGGTACGRELLWHIISLYFPVVSLPGQNRVIRDNYKILV